MLPEHASAACPALVPGAPAARALQAQQPGADAASTAAAAAAGTHSCGAAEVSRDVLQSQDVTVPAAPQSVHHSSAQEADRSDTAHVAHEPARASHSVSALHHRGAEHGKAGDATSTSHATVSNLQAIAGHNSVVFAAGTQPGGVCKDTSITKVPAGTPAVPDSSQANTDEWDPSSHVAVLESTQAKHTAHDVRTRDHARAQQPTSHDAGAHAASQPPAGPAGTDAHSAQVHKASLNAAPAAAAAAAAAAAPVPALPAVQPAPPAHVTGSFNAAAKSSASQQMQSLPAAETANVVADVDDEGEWVGWGADQSTQPQPVLHSAAANVPEPVAPAHVASIVDDEDDDFFAQLQGESAGVAPDSQERSSAQLAQPQLQQSGSGRHGAGVLASPGSQSRAGSEQRPWAPTPRAGSMSQRSSASQQALPAAHVGAPFGSHAPSPAASSVQGEHALQRQSSHTNQHVSWSAASHDAHQHQQVPDGAQPPIHQKASCGHAVSQGQQGRSVPNGMVQPCADGQTHPATGNNWHAPSAQQPQQPTPRGGSSALLRANSSGISVGHTPTAPPATLGQIKTQPQPVPRSATAAQSSWHAPQSEHGLGHAAAAVGPAVAEPEEDDFFGSLGDDAAPPHQQSAVIAGSPRNMHETSTLAAMAASDAETGADLTAPEQVGGSAATPAAAEQSTPAASYVTSPTAAASPAAPDAADHQADSVQAAADREVAAYEAGEPWWCEEWGCWLSACSVYYHDGAVWQRVDEYEANAAEAAAAAAAAATDLAAVPAADIDASVAEASGLQVVDPRTGEGGVPYNDADGGATAAADSSGGYAHAGAAGTAQLPAWPNQQDGTDHAAAQQVANGAVSSDEQHSAAVAQIGPSAGHSTQGMHPLQHSDGDDVFGTFGASDTNAQAISQPLEQRVNHANEWPNSEQTQQPDTSTAQSNDWHAGLQQHPTHVPWQPPTAPTASAGASPPHQLQPPVTHHSPPSASQTTPPQHLGSQQATQASAHQRQPSAPWQPRGAFQSTPAARSGLAHSARLQATAQPPAASPATAPTTAAAPRSVAEARSSSAGRPPLRRIAFGIGGRAALIDTPCASYPAASARIAVCTTATAASTIAGNRIATASPMLQAGRLKDWPGPLSERSGNPKALAACAETRAAEAQTAQLVSVAVLWRLLGVMVMHKGCLVGAGQSGKVGGASAAVLDVLTAAYSGGQSNSVLLPDFAMTGADANAALQHIEAALLQGQSESALQAALQAKVCCVRYWTLDFQHDKVKF